MTTTKYIVKVVTEIPVYSDSEENAIDKAMRTTKELTTWLDPHDVFTFKIEQPCESGS